MVTPSTVARTASRRVHTKPWIAAERIAAAAELAAMENETAVVAGTLKLAAEAAAQAADLLLSARVRRQSLHDRELRYLYSRSQPLATSLSLAHKCSRLICCSRFQKNTTRKEN